MSQSLRSFQLACPFKSLILRDAGQEVTRTDLRVSDDSQWTLEQDVQICPPGQPVPTRGLLVWCGDNDAAIIQVAWERARDILGVPARIPKGTSLLGLLATL
jgi:hypothetical protein